MSNTRQVKRIVPEHIEKLLALFETIPGALFIIDDAATIVYANASARNLTGATREALYGKSLWWGASQLMSAALYLAVQKTRQTRVPTEVEYVSPMTRTWLHVQLAPTAEGLLVQFHQGRAATGRQETVPQGECLGIDALDGLYSRIGVLTPEGIVLEINEAFLADAHLRREEIIGQPLAQTPCWSGSPTSQEQLRSAIARACTGETVHFETEVLSREGARLHLEITLFPRVDADQRICYLLIAGIDITARKLAEADIYALVDTIPQFVWIMRPDGSCEYRNRRWCDYTGLSPEQAQGDGWLQCIHPDSQQHVRAMWQHAVESGEMFEAEQCLRQGTTGEYRWFLARAMPLRNERGQILKWFGTDTDIEEQKRIEAALRQTQKRAHVLMNSNIIGIFVREGEQIVDANDTFLSMTGYSREDLCAGRMNYIDMTPPEYRARARVANQELATRQSLTPYEKEYMRQDGSCLPVLVGEVVLEHHPFRLISFVLDNSVRKELEQRKDDFINMASHELRTPLTALKLQVQMARKRFERRYQKEEVKDILQLERPIEQLGRLITELLDVSKIQAGGLEYRQQEVDLDALLRETVETMHHLYPGHTIVVRGSVQASLIGDRDRLGEVFANLLSNAIKYSPNAQTVEMDLSSSPEAAIIRVRDHGLGIPQEQREKIFERFYRAAVLRQGVIPGLGVGLYIVAEIVKYHGGAVSVESEVGKGSTFTVTLPLKNVSARF